MEPSNARFKIFPDAVFGSSDAKVTTRGTMNPLNLWLQCRRNYAVVGTPNRLEYDQGFFVKLGDGAADVKPIAHLYKSQVYAMARHLQLPEAICSTSPTTDTFSLAQGQDEFYFGLPYSQMDFVLWHLNQGLGAAELARELGCDELAAAVHMAAAQAKRRTTAYLHTSPVLAGEVSGIPATGE